MLNLEVIDNGNSFDFGKTSLDYANYRDVYPQSFYNKLYNFGIGIDGQEILDLGTGTGVIPRNLIKCHAKFTGIDISEEQIEQAKFLSENQGLNIKYLTTPVENIEFQESSFDVVMACQCWWYFDKQIALPKIKKILKNPGGKLVVMYMNWLPFEDEIAKATEELVLKYNPDWTGCNFRRHELSIPEWSKELFNTEALHTYTEGINFSIESWMGRIRACRGIGASLPCEIVREFDKEHYKLLKEITNGTFTILHQIWIEIYVPK